MLRAQLEKGGLSVFKDDQSIREGDLWLDRLQEAVDGCTGFVVLVGRDGVGRWIGAETQTALIRYFGPHDDAKRLPIFPVLLGETAPESLPAFLRLFQATRWNGSDPLPERLLEQIRKRDRGPAEAPSSRAAPSSASTPSGSTRPGSSSAARRRPWTPLACFDTRRGSRTVRWLEINGNSGSRQVLADERRPAAPGGAGLAVAAHRYRPLAAHRPDDAGPASGRDAGRVPGPLLPRGPDEPPEMADVRRCWRPTTAPWPTGCAGASATTPPSCSPSTSSRSCSPSPTRTSASTSTACSRPPWRRGLPAVPDLDGAGRLPRSLRRPAVSDRPAQPPRLPLDLAAGRRRRRARDHRRPGAARGSGRQRGAGGHGRRCPRRARRPAAGGERPRVALGAARRQSIERRACTWIRAGSPASSAAAPTICCTDWTQSAERALELLFNLVKVDPDSRQHTRRRIPYAEARGRRRRRPRARAG